MADTVEHLAKRNCVGYIIAPSQKILAIRFILKLTSDHLTLCNGA